MLNVNVDLEGKAETDFIELKDKLSFKNNTEVLRWAIRFTNEQYRAKKDTQIILES